MSWVYYVVDALVKVVYNVAHNPTVAGVSSWVEKETHHAMANNAFRDIVFFAMCALAIAIAGKMAWDFITSIRRVVWGIISFALWTSLLAGSCYVAYALKGGSGADDRHFADYVSTWRPK